MSLAGRLTAFFLGALALVLIGFSASLYFWARTHFYRQADERLEGALDTLSAAAEVTPDGVEWEPQQQRLSLGQDADDAQVRWAVYDGRGHIVDRSRNLGAEALLEESAPVVAAGVSETDHLDRAGRPWRLRQRSLESESPRAAHSQAGEQQRNEPRYPVLILRAGLSLEPLQATLRTLAMALSGLSVFVWLLAALVGRRLCQRALVPVTGMADAVRAMQPANLQERLPSPGTGDALEDLGRAFNDLLSRLHEAFERQRRFTGDASHQLRTPLAVMLGQVEVALRRQRPAEEYRRVLQIVSEQAGRLNRLIEMLLFLARADADSAAPALIAVPIKAWLQEHLREWATHPRAADIRLVPAESAQSSALIHAPLLGQVVDILLDNACKYSQPGTPISISSRGDGEHVELSVADKGFGIDPSDLPRIFDPFFRCLRQNGRVGDGVGLGLAIAKRATDAMGGKIDVESVAGRGSQFRVLLTAAGAEMVVSS